MAREGGRRGGEAPCCTQPQLLAESLLVGAVLPVPLALLLVLLLVLLLIPWPLLLVLLLLVLLLMPWPLLLVLLLLLANCLPPCRGLMLGLCAGVGGCRPAGPTKQQTGRLLLLLLPPCVFFLGVCRTATPMRR